MTFFDLPRGSFSPTAQFYFNVAVYEMGIEQQEENNIKYIVQTHELTAERPRLYVLYPVPYGEGEVTIYDHQVVIVDGMEIYWADMIDFDTKELWRI